MKSIYTHYKDRLVEISGRNRSIYTKTFSKKTGYDLGRLFRADATGEEDFINFLWTGKPATFELLSSENDTAKKAHSSIMKAKAQGDSSARTEKRTFPAWLENEVNDFATLLRETEEMERETGRYELYVGYPFVTGSVRDLVFRAPLILFPVELEIDGSFVTLRKKKGDLITLNKALLYAYAQARKINVDGLETEYESLTSAGLKTIGDVVNYVNKFGYRFSNTETKRIVPLSSVPEPDGKSVSRIHRACVLARYVQANAIYSDYNELERKNIVNDATLSLLSPTKVKEKKKRAKKSVNYIVSDLDFAQKSVVQKVSDSGNMVIYGPPGTGKSQTIVNIISDAIANGKRVLVVSQKKAALDVVYNRLGNLNDKAMFIVDAMQDRHAFYDRCHFQHEKVLATKTSDNVCRRFDIVGQKLQDETERLWLISSVLTKKTAFGLNLVEMYANSYILPKSGVERNIYNKITKDELIMSFKYDELRQAIDNILGGKLDIYYEYVEARKKNPFVQSLRRNVPTDTLLQARGRIKDLLSSRLPVFDVNGSKYARHILAHYNALDDKASEKFLIKTLTVQEHHKSQKFLSTSKVLFPLYPVAKINMLGKEKQTRKDYDNTIKALNRFISDYAFLKGVLTTDGYYMALTALLDGNQSALVNLRAALDEYVKMSDLHASFEKFSPIERELMNLAYGMTSSYDACVNVIKKFIPVRVYHEIVVYEDAMKNELSLSVEFESIKTRILSLLQEQKEIAKLISAQGFVAQYRALYESRKDKKDYLYQIGKKQDFWPIRKTIEQFGEYLFTLFPCWLLSPENVSSLLPLKKNLFDIVIFDEASQVFIENTIPSVVRGKNIVVAGDAKQLRPTATFMRRYMGGGEEEDLSTQAALEVESLLDLAVARYDSAHINYHYRSERSELIEFSNKAFYENRLHIAPNVSSLGKNTAIERIKVNGVWADSKNEVEATAVVTLIDKILRTRKEGETIGVITFGVQQQNCIESVIEKYARQHHEFRTRLAREVNRKEDGQDVSLFIKNIENVQGDERDIIIFAVGYAPGANGKVYAHFGSLSMDGGENRLNVAITRAKKKIYVVTSIEPEELNVDSSKNNGPKLFRSYLAYARAVSANKSEEANAILESVGNVVRKKKQNLITPIDQQIASKLTAMGFKVDTQIGEGLDKISVAVMDKKTNRYALGIQVDSDLFDEEHSALERDVFSAKFLSSRGWRIMRVWSRDWWHDSKGVISAIVETLRDAGITPEPKVRKKKTEND